ncbi:hypothetical protein TRFO_18926 [Tritrichomonas foetus]|uniref:Protein kinase domain-containing protein n=1 Tax=Tritrichomonas foetus TaxID=1144522 RepID=A0A1J4KJT8_9EUKA|nr:hypothetical protein TRFO_18926 [Tritrichomonas foetus]|eukprot:OHT11567.1 hypothetical protein TRFO_18926 [Tritrichomonas foetus]
MNYILETLDTAINKASHAYVYNRECEQVASVLSSYKENLKKFHVKNQSDINELQKFVDQLLKLTNITDNLCFEKWANISLNEPVTKPMMEINLAMNYLGMSMSKIGVDNNKYQPNQEDLIDDFQSLYGVFADPANTNLKVHEKREEVAIYLRQFHKPLPGSVVEIPDGMMFADLERYKLLPTEYTKDIIISEDRNITTYRGILKEHQAYVKILKVRVDEEQANKDLFKRIVMLLSSIQHPSICPFIGACFENYEIVTQESGESLRTLIQKKILKDNGTAKTVIAFKIAEAMTYLHAKSIIHRDLCASNILVDDDFNINITGFANLRFIPDDEFIDATLVGDERFRAPELISGEEYREPVDVFAFAAILYELLTGAIPFGEMSQIQANCSIEQKKRPFIPTCSPDLTMLIQMCWDQNPKCRPPFCDIIRIMEKQKIAFPGSREEEISNFYALSRAKSTDVESCLRLFHEICTKINYIEFYQRQLIRVRATLYGYQYELQNSEHAKTEELEYETLADLDNLKTSLWQLLTAIDNLHTEKFQNYAFTSEVHRPTFELVELMEQVYISMCNLGLTVSKYVPVKSDIATDYRYLYFTFNDFIGEVPFVSQRLEEIQTFLKSYNLSIELTDADVKGMFKKIFFKFRTDVVSRERFELNSNHLNGGKTALVYVATDKETNKEVAVKQFFDSYFTDEISMRNLKREIYFLVTLKHKYLVDFIGFNAEALPFWIIMEYVPAGDLFGLISNDKLDAYEKTKIALEVAEGMEYLHSKQVMHRDLKTSNILVQYHKKTFEPIPKIADFGYARINTSIEMTIGVGTTNYEAPEVINGGMYDFKADVFSYSMVLWEMISGVFPYYWLGNDKLAIERSIISGVELPFQTKSNEPSVSEDLEELVRKCWSLDPEERYTFSEIIEIMISKRIAFPGADPKRIETFYAKKEKRRRKHHRHNQENTYSYEFRTVNTLLKSSQIMDFQK